VKFRRQFHPPIAPGCDRTLVADGVEYCGTPWCLGACGRPKLVLRRAGGLFAGAALIGIEPVFGRALDPRWAGLTDEVAQCDREAAEEAMWR